MNKEIVLIHGWGTENYNSNLDCDRINEGVAWEKRSELINLLQRKYHLRYFNLPGFCCVPEPNEPFFDIEDFSDSLAKWLDDKDLKPAAIIGYSFGGAVALDYKVRYDTNIPVILMAPALKRRETIKSHLGQIGKRIIPVKYSAELKSLYQSLFSRYYRKGTPFLRASYDKIARRDIRPLLEMINPRDILLIYGDSDSSTPVDYVTEYVNKNNLNFVVIEGGGHNIGGTNPNEVSKAIIEFVSK